MLKNRRGEVITIAVLGMCILVGVLGAFVGASKYGKFIGLGGADQKIVKTVKSEPILIGEKGNQYWVMKTEESTSNADIPMTLIQRIMMLPRILIILVILGCIFPPLGAILIAFYVRLKGGFKQMVNGINEAQQVLPKESNDILATNLSRKMNTDTKTLVKKIKVKL